MFYSCSYIYGCNTIFATVWVVNRSHVPHCQTSYSLRDPVASLLTICSIATAFHFSCSRVAVLALPSFSVGSTAAFSCHSLDPTS